MSTIGTAVFLTVLWTVALLMIFAMRIEQWWKERSYRRTRRR